MPTQSKSRREEYAELTRAALVSAGSDRFAEQGYAKTSIMQIADDARVSKGAFYHHFSDKKALLKAVLNEACDRSATKIEEAVASQSESGDLVSAALDAAMEAIQVDGQYRELRQQSVGVLDDDERRELDNRIRVPLVSKIFDRLEGQGQLRDDVDLSAATVLVVGLLETALDDMTTSDDPTKRYSELRPILLGFINSLTG
ncbi:MAG TPA: TetR/AcrR family transcriptional regulator [Candidatus Corynebacterium avicola]|uniref:TetR/AcrR family transcriptional regulator n=1 Tax=Candidatus Corynebacterium avicola TaxID=2838527 RepID=A0A9D1RLL2_9CORY|nr:TetR/AcrR family transcriptional regulator [Candidatus Corynebacterium avicola]